MTRNGNRSLMVDFQIHFHLHIILMREKYNKERTVLHILIDFLSREKIDFDDYVKEKSPSLCITHEGFIDNFSWGDKIYVLKEPVPYVMKFEDGFWAFDIPSYEIYVGAYNRLEAINDMHLFFEMTYDFIINEPHKYAGQRELDRFELIKNNISEIIVGKKKTTVEY
jgi:hypothetical protein